MLQPSAPKMRVLHLTDLHYDTKYRAGADAAFDAKHCVMHYCHYDVVMLQPSVPKVRVLHLTDLHYDIMYRAGADTAFNAKHDIMPKNIIDIMT